LKKTARNDKIVANERKNRHNRQNPGNGYRLGQSGNRAIGQSGNRAIGQSGNRAIGQLYTFYKNRVNYPNYLTSLFNTKLTLFSSLGKRRIFAYMEISAFYIATIEMYLAL
jgi:hypothetical protein